MLLFFVVFCCSADGAICFLSVCAVNTSSNVLFVFFLCAAINLHPFVVVDSVYYASRMNFIKG